MLNKTLSTVLVAIALMSVPPVSAGDRYEPSACKQTARTLYHACKYDVRDNYYETLANCQNLASLGERKACYRDADAERQDERAFCGDVKEARTEACEVLNEDRYDTDPLLTNDFIHPDQVPDEFAPNPYVSVAAGHTYVLRAGEEGGETVVVHVTDDTREILGVSCRVVVDIVVETSKDDETGDVEYEAVEVTDDWFAQTLAGDVVYCGEIARNFEDGVLRDLDGSFEAGLDFAKSGFLALNTPIWGLAHRQEFALGEAEDIIQYIDLGTAPSAEEGGNNANEKYSCGTDKCLKTFDFAPIDPESTEYKYYLPGTGFVLAVAMDDGEITGEREELMCVGDSLDVLSDDPDCGIADPELLLEELCTLAAGTFCED
ncbi:MAG: hypothetical protein OEY37_00970 [Gammaproteobacteria bacterium]|nr:hypothetical protein [Gammaproteobacteria bacterium]